MTAAATSRRKLGRYEIVAEIARGGMGTVYLARLEGVAGFQRLFAIKLLHQHLAEEERFVTMLLDEARLAARLHHPNAVGIVDVSDSALGYYLVMDYVDGFTLDLLMRKLEGDLERRAKLGLRCLLDASVGLDAAHRLTDDDGNPLGIVHRDVSPQNVLVGCDGAGRITDFGVARAAARITASRPGMLKGKPCYMAPEQARGDDELDARADVFALGIILWEVLTGKMLFQSSGGAAVTLMQVVNAEIRLPSEVHSLVPSALDEVCMRALDRDAATRFQSAREFAEALETTAREVGWLASNRAVADAVGELFESEIRLRKKAIRTHSEALGRSSEPMMASDIYDVPRLKAQREGAATSASTPISKSQSKSEPWHETPAVVAPPPGSQETLPTISEVRSRETKRPPVLLAGVLAVVGLGLLVTAFFVTGDDGAMEQAERLRAEEAEARAAEEVRADEARAIEARAAEARAAEAEARARADEARLAAEQLASDAERRERELAEAEAAMQGMRTTMSSMSSMTGMSTASMASMGPAFENNPYLTQ